MLGVLDVELDLLLRAQLSHFALLPIQLDLREGRIIEDAALHQMLDPLEVVDGLCGYPLLHVLVFVQGLFRQHAFLPLRAVLVLGRLQLVQARRERGLLTPVRNVVVRLRHFRHW